MTSNLSPRHARAFRAAVSLVLPLCSVLCLAPNGHSQIYSLTNGNSFAMVNTTNQIGMYNWTVDGVSQLYQQWFWYRIGSRGGEKSIDTLSAPVVSLFAPNRLATTYANPKMSVQISYTLNGGTAGSGASKVYEDITIKNRSPGNLDLHFFQYSDFDLLGTSGNDHVQLFRDSSTGKYTQAIQWDGDVSIKEFWSNSSVQPGANHGEATFWPVLLKELNDSKPSTLADTVGVVGSGGDVDWGFEWDLNIAKGGSITIHKEKDLVTPPMIVPEPATLTWLALGFLGFLARPRHRA